MLRLESHSYFVNFVNSDIDFIKLCSTALPYYSEPMRSPAQRAHPTPSSKNMAKEETMLHNTLVSLQSDYHQGNFSETSLDSDLNVLNIEMKIVCQN